MGIYIGQQRLNYLWEKIKNLLATGLSGKADKATTLSGYGITDAINTSSTAQTKTGNLTAAKFITKNGTSSQVVRGDGNLVDSKLLPQYEAYLEWGGKNLAGSYGPIDAAMVSELGAPRTMFPKAAGIVVEYSTDGGNTWVDYGANDTQKIQLFSTGYTFRTGKNTSASGTSINNMLRVSLYTSAASIYTELNKFVIFVSTNGSSGCYCTIRCRTQQNYEDNVDTWVTKAEQVPLSGFSGYNVINISATRTYGNAKATQYGEWQFIFGYTGISSEGYTGLVISKISGFGGVGWTCPSDMAKTGHLYAFDANQKATFPAQVQATSFKKTGGTSSQFLKADGSVDSNTYLTATDISGKANVSDVVTALGTNGNNITWTKNGQVNNLTVPYATKALQDGNGKTISSTYLPLSGGNMNSEATVRFSTYGTRYLTVSGNNIKHDLSLATGGYAGSFYSIKTTGSDGEQHDFTGIGFYGGYGNGTGLNYLYIAGENDSFSNPAVKITPEGFVTFKNAITAKSFVKTGGTSSQFLKADGSVDSNTYLTSFTETDPTVPAWAKAANKPSYTAAEVGALQLGDYYAD